MKSTAFIRTIIILTVAVCSGCSRTGTQDDALITVDVTANYPHKKLVLQDFMDVEYIPLETTDEFLCRGSVWGVGKDIIVVTNFGDTNGDIFLFNRKGKGLRKINHKGGGNEEYSGFARIALDEENGEIYVNDQHGKKIFVYDLEGNFKRRLLVNENYSLFEMYNFDRDHLICHDDFVNNTGQAFMLISKQDGSTTKEFQIPFKEKKSIIIRVDHESISGMYYRYNPRTMHPVMPYFNDYILTEYASDTLYRCSPDHPMKPFIVRTPSIQSTNPEKYILMSMLTDQYYFMEAVEKTIEFSATDLVYDKQEKAFFRYKVYNADYEYEKEAFLKSRPLNSQIPSCQYLEADELVRDYERGRLKGQLKEVAAKLDPEDNPVIMLIKHKK